VLSARLDRTGCGRFKTAKITGLPLRCLVGPVFIGPVFIGPVFIGPVFMGTTMNPF
jgi:hypothetical protein